MRNRVFWNSPHTQLFSCMAVLSLLVWALTGCGGGGGNGGGNNGSTNGSTNGTTNGNTGTTVSITGKVKDNSTKNAPVVGATVTIVGTSLTARTDVNGNFSFASVPSSATAFTVNNPNTANYFSYANFNNKYYDILACTFPLPALHSGTNAVGEVDLYTASGNTPPPPPPINGCPTP